MDGRLLDSPPVQEHMSFGRPRGPAGRFGRSDPAEAPPAAPPAVVRPADAAGQLAAAVLALTAGQSGRDDETRELVATLAGRVSTLESTPARVVRFELTDRKTKEVEHARPELAKLVGRFAAGFRNLWLTGPAGSGKTTLAHTFADAISSPFGFQSFAADSTAASLLGGVNAAGVYQESAFVAAYESGAVYLLDEIDAAPAEIIVAINAALANGHLALPRHNDQARRVIKRHADTVIICAANTWGTGPNSMYVGRAALDAATLDRFVGAKFEIGYDQALEARILDDSQLRAKLFAIRDALTRNKIKRLISTRAMVAAARLKAAGLTTPEIIEELLIDWTPEERAKVA